MKKQLLAITMIAMLMSSGVIALADDSYMTPAVQYAPAEEANEYQTQYPLPSYQPQGYQGYDNNSYTNVNQQQLQGNVILVPANTTFEANVMTPLSSDTLKMGDNVSLYLGSDFYYGGKLVAGAGSRINGVVTQAKKGGYASRNGSLQVKFNNLITTTGQVIPLAAHIVTDDGSGILKAGTAKDAVGEYAKNVGLGAASGAALGTAMGALSRGSVGRGAIYGTAVGGGLGLAKALMDRGDDVDIPQNAQINLVLEQPLTVTTNSVY